MASPPRRPRSPLVFAALAAALILFGGLLWFRPYLETKTFHIAEVATGPALFSLSEFALLPGQSACMSTITITPNSGIAEFHLRPGRPGLLGPPVELVLSAPGYRSVVHVPGGYPGGGVALPMTPPRRTQIGTACFIDRGRSEVLLDGTIEPRTVTSRTRTVLNGRAIDGDIALTFLASSPQAPIERLGEIFGHASNLTDRLVPVWLIWVIAILTALVVPVGVVVAFYLSLRDDQGSGPWQAAREG